MIMVAGCNNSSTNDNSNIYGVAMIGSQIWMSENLNVDHFRNGDPIPEAKTKEEWQRAAEKQQPAWCYYNNDPAMGEKYGKLYNWYAVNDSRQIAPEGFHIPTKAEYNHLIEFLGGEKNAGIKLKNTSGWDFCLCFGNHGWGDGNNKSGFSGLPGGHLITGLDFGFGYKGEQAIWWTSSYDNQLRGYAICYILYNFDQEVTESGAPFDEGLSVRCIKD